MKKIGLFALCICVFLITFWSLYKTTPDYIIRVHREHSFVVKKSFNNVRKDLYQRDLMEEIIESHGGKLLGIFGGENMGFFPPFTVLLVLVRFFLGHFRGHYLKRSSTLFFEDA